MKDNQLLTRIKELLSKEEISFKKLSESIGMSVFGLKLALQKNTIKVETLEKISKILNVSIHDFFLDETKHNYKETSELHIENEIINKRVQELEQQLKDKTEIIKYIDKHLKNVEINSTYFVYKLLSKHFDKKDIFELMKMSFCVECFDITLLNKINKIGLEKFEKEHIKEYPSLYTIKEYILEDKYNDLSKI